MANLTAQTDRGSLRRSTRSIVLANRKNHNYPFINPGVPSSVAQPITLAQAQNYDGPDDPPSSATQVITPAQAHVQKFKQLVDMLRNAQAFAQEVTSDTAKAFDGGAVYSETELLNALNSLQDTASDISAVVRLGRQYTKFDKFTQFEKLPLELRTKIWGYSLNVLGPRVIPIWPSKPPSQVKTSNLGKKKVKKGVKRNTQSTVMMVHCPPPALLSVCHESRKLALEKFTWKPDTPGHMSVHRADPKEDTIYFSEGEDGHFNDLETFTSFCNPSVWAQVKHLAMDSCFWQDSDMTMTMIQHFTCIETLSFVMKCARHEFTLNWQNPRLLGSKVCFEEAEDKNDHLIDEIGDFYCFKQLEDAFKEHAEEEEKKGIEWVPPEIEFKVIAALDCEYCGYSESEDHSCHRCHYLY